jgi:hypothetical protein
MAKAEFINGVKVAARFLSPKAETDDDKLNPEKLQTKLLNAALWLTPSAVKGFDARDFPELSDTVRGQLSAAVERFRSVAKEVPPTQPPTAAQIKAGLTAFLAILGILQPYLPSDAARKRVTDALSKLRLPDDVVAIQYELALDSSGDPAVRLWVIVKDEAAQRKSFPEEAAKIQDQIMEVFVRTGVERWPYVSFRTTSEQRAL